MVLEVVWVVWVDCGWSCDVVVVVLLCVCGAMAGSCVVVVVLCVWAIADSDRASANAAPVKSDPIFLNAIRVSPVLRLRNGMPWMGIFVKS